MRIAKQTQGVDATVCDLSVISAALSARRLLLWAEDRQVDANSQSGLHVMGASVQTLHKIEENAKWSISAPQSDDQAKAAQTVFSSLLSSSWDWSVTRLSKTRSVRHSVTVPQRPNRNWHKPQTEKSNDTTHVTLLERGSRYFATVLFSSASSRCTPCARAVHTNHTPNPEVSAC